MATPTRPETSSGAGRRRQSSRLQRRAPASIEISPASSWNEAIPLLSPLVTSPDDHRTVEVKSREEPRPAAEKVEPPVFKKWQHPAAPFYYEPAPLLPPFVPV